jgi:hypothetical protein
MVLTRPVRHAGRPPATRTPPDPAAVPRGAARHAAHLEVLLGDPRDPGNPYGRSALWAAGPGALPAPPAGLPAAGNVPADELARALRPLFRRDLALAHAWSIRPLASAPVPHPAAALLGPAALLAATGGVLRGVTRIVDGLSRHEAAARQWRPVLATVFADLLACESMTAAALRSCPATAQQADGDAELLAAVVGYLVPRLAVELLGDLELVLNECGFDGHTVERRTLARILRDRAFAGADRAATGAAQARIVRGLSAAGGAGQDDGTRLAALFRGTGAVPEAATGTGGRQAVTSAPAGAEARPTPGGDDADTAALARLGRRLASERRALRVAAVATAVHDPADPAARALADRQALLVLAAQTLGARAAAAEARLPFLGGAGWTLSALGRITVRLGLPLPAPMPDGQSGVWAELARRVADGVDCDLYATRLSW